MDEAVNRLIIEASPSVDFTDRDNEQFHFDLTGSELAIIPSLMYEQYLFRDFSYLKTLNVNYTPTEMRVFDPSNARATFLNIYNILKYIIFQNTTFEACFKPKKFTVTVSSTEGGTAQTSSTIVDYDWKVT